MSNYPAGSMYPEDPRSPLNDSDESDILSDLQVLYECFTSFAAQHYCGCGHSACSNCIDDNLTDWKENNNTLLLFYNYRPWRQESFCADNNNSIEHNGSVTILGEHVNAFKAQYINGMIRIYIEMNQSVRGSKASIHLSKQKGIF